MVTYILYLCLKNENRWKYRFTTGKSPNPIWKTYGNWFFLKGEAKDLPLQYIRRSRTNREITRNRNDLQGYKQTPEPTYWADLLARRTMETTN
jgi:hypothetical protein